MVRFDHAAPGPAVFRPPFSQGLAFFNDVPIGSVQCFGSVRTHDADQGFANEFFRNNAGFFAGFRVGEDYFAITVNRGNGGGLAVGDNTQEVAHRLKLRIGLPQSFGRRSDAHRRAMAPNSKNGRRHHGDHQP